MMANVELALELARRYGGIDGDHHKAWVIDQMVRALTGCCPNQGDGALPAFDNSADYIAFVADAKAGEDGPDTYAWDEGIAP